MRAVRILVVFSLAFPTLHCSKTDPPAPQITAVLGAVTSTAGSPLSGVAVSGGGATATTDAAGKFQLDAPAGPATTLTFVKAGYVPTRKTVDVQDKSATALQVAMMAEAPAVQLDATAGGTATATRGAALTAEAGVFVSKAGAAVTGTVDVHLTPFDPSKEAELKAVPNFSADAKDGKRVELESFGLMDVTVRKDGETLQVQSGKKLTVRIPAPAGATSPPATIALWSFDESAGRWKEEGTATYNATDKVYEGEIGHMSMWNADQPMSATCIRGLVKVESGAALPGAQVTGNGVDYFGSSMATTGMDGRFCMVVRKSSKVRVLAVHPTGGGTSREVQSGSTDSPVPPNCGDPGCLDVGEWVIKPGSVVGPGGTVIDCKNVSSPFAGTCAEGMWDFMSCFAASGKCTVNMLTSITSWESGSKLQITPGVNTAMTYLGPTGQKCATAEIKSASEAGSEMVFNNLVNGKSYTMKYDANGNGSVICPDGTEVKIDKDKLETVQACTGADQKSQQCSIEGMPGQCDPANPQCPSGQQCCTISDMFSMCLPQCPQ